jgi:hypothetical protein
MKEKFRDYTILSFIFILIISIYYKIDYSISLEYNFFPWDGFAYHKIAEAFDLKTFNINSNFISPNGTNPFGERILFPIFYKIFAIITEKNLIISALSINLLGSYISFVCFFILAKYFKIRSIQIFLASIAFMLFWGGPLRQSISNPGMSFPFEAGLISLVCLNLFLLEKNSYKNIYLYIFNIFIICLATFQRGIVIVIISAIPIIVCFFPLSKKNTFNIIIKNYKKIICLIFSIISLIVLKKITTTPTDYLLFKSVIKYSYFNLNIINFLYTFFVYLGPFFLLTMVYFFQKKNIKERLFFLTKRAINSKTFLTIICISIILSKIGGDPDRPMLWFWNYYLLIGIVCFNLIKKKSLIIKSCLIITTILWCRPYIPAQVPLVFSNTFVKNHFVETNFDEKYFKGPLFLKKYKNEVERIYIPFGEPYNLEYHNNVIHSAKITKGKYDIGCKALCAANPYVHSYKNRINNIPFPLGYIHNQKDALIDHPLLGQPWVLYMLTIQWILVTLAFIFILKKNIR